ncbi:hypothetical protein SUDANB105_08110 (plasmid) [Streptomyces sp. enrichment culture]|uniref:hypothetical protein n=1 Tax=Streptomyces sp. enrichment culture TaxID=1795815 RepID=UPI003F570C76
MIRNAAICDQAGCLALYLDPANRPEDQPFDTALAAAGWGLDDVAGHRCPGCTRGTGPVLERGECPRCCGSTVDRHDGAACHYCGHVSPHPDEEDEDDLTDVG